MKRQEKQGPEDGEVERVESVERDLEEYRSERHGAISYDPRTPEGELLHLQVCSDPGCSPALRDGWRGKIREWGICSWVITDEKTGEEVELPSILLIPETGEPCRLTGWPAISSWSTLVRAAGVERIRAGLDVIVKRRQSGSTGRSYWTILVDIRKGER